MLTTDRGEAQLDIAQLELMAAECSLCARSFGTALRVSDVHLPGLFCTIIGASRSESAALNPVACSIVRTFRYMASLPYQRQKREQRLEELEDELGNAAEVCGGGCCSGGICFCFFKVKFRICSFERLQKR